MAKKKRQTQLTEHINIEQEENTNQLKWRKIEVKFKTESQEKLWNELEKNEISFVTGPAGTGKTYLSVLKALDLISKENTPYQKIVIVKPVVEADEKLGALPGTLEEKLEPYVYSYFYIFEKLLGRRKLEKLLERGIIEIMALAYLRGVNIDNSIVIFDEAQNCTGKQMRTFLTRIGEDSKYFICGDIEQSDRFADKDISKSGFYIAMNKLKDIKGIGVFQFNSDDTVRNKIISKILEKLNGSIQ